MANSRYMNENYRVPTLPGMSWIFSRKLQNLESQFWSWKDILKSHAFF